MKSKLRFSASVWREGKYYVAQCLNIDISSFGKSKNEALKNLTEALALYFEDKPRRMPKIATPSIVVRDLEYA